MSEPARSWDRAPPIAVVRLAGALDSEGVARLATEVLDRADADPELVVVDGQGAAAATHAGVAALVRLAERVRIWPGTALVLAAGGRPAAAVRASGHADRLLVCPTVAQAGAMARAAYRRVRRRLPPSPKAAPTARHLVTEACRSWGLADVCDGAELVTSELVGNAVRYAGHDIELAVSLYGGELRIRVYDGDPHPLDRSVPAGADAESGRGLQLVAALARAWGSLPVRGGKVVWASIPVPGY
jgi:Histidine kinase-like ATPase domain